LQLETIVFASKRKKLVTTRKLLVTLKYEFASRQKIL